MTLADRFSSCENIVWILNVWEVASPHPPAPGHGFQQTTIWFCTQNNNKKVKIYIYIFQKPEHSKKYVFLSKCIEKNQKNTVNKVEENEPEKLNNLLITDYAKVKNKEQ